MENSNRLIAEFMGWNIQNPTTIPTNLHLSNLELDNGEVMELKFNTSWDWLMPVIEKIESLGYVFTIQGGKAEYGEMISETRCFIAEDKMSSTYKAVVEFIKEYNQKPKKAHAKGKQENWTEVYTETCYNCNEEIEYTDIFSMCPLCLQAI